MYLLDTNHCSFILVQQDESVLNRLLEIGKEKISINSIIYGELLLMVGKSQRRKENLKKLEEFIHAIKILPIDKDTTKIYGELTFKMCEQHMPTEKKERRNFRIKDIGVRTNDLWIACTAIQHNLTIVSEDRDFRIISQFRELKLECWKVRISQVRSE